jgi:hypothetical protein
VAATDLCGLDDVRKHLQRQTGATEQDDVLEALITRLSRAIARDVGRELAPAADNKTRTLEFDPRHRLVPVAPWDLRAVTAVLVDQGLATEQTLTADQWRLTVHDPDFGLWRALELPYVHPVSTWRTRRLTITGDWGFAEVPDEAAQACISAVTMYVRGEVQAFGGALQPNSLGEGVNDDELLPPGLRGLVKHLELPVYV